MKDNETPFLVEIDKIPHFFKENVEITKQTKKFKTAFA